MTRRWSEPWFTRVTRTTLGSRPRSTGRWGSTLLGGPPTLKTIQRCQDILAETEGNRTLSAEMFHALGHLLARRGAFEEALGFASRCRDINRENGAMWAYWMARRDPVGHQDAGRRARGGAGGCSPKATSSTERMGASLPIASAFLAQSLYALERFDEAEDRARVAVDAVDDDWARFTGMGVLARVLAQRGRLEEAERMAREAVTHFEGTELSIERTTVLMDLAEVLRLAGRTDEVVLTLRTALELFEQKGDVVSAARARVLIDDLTNAGA